VIEFTGTVVYTDGRRETFTGGQVELGRWELYAIGRGIPSKIQDAPQMMLSLVLAYHALRREGRLEPEGLGLEPWLDSVRGVENYEATDADPFPTAATVERSGP